MCVCVCVCVCVFCHVQLFATPWTVARQAPLSMEFSGKNTGGIAISCSRASSWLRDWRCFLQWPANTLHRATWEAGTKIHVCISWCLRWHLLCKEGLNGKGHEMVWKVWGDLFLQSGKFHCELKARRSPQGSPDRAKSSPQRASFFAHLMLNQLHLSQCCGDLVTHRLNSF